MPDNMGKEKLIFGLDKERYYCVRENCGEKAHAWAVVELGGLDPQAAMICSVKIHYFCEEHWEEREQTTQPRQDIFLN